MRRLAGIVVTFAVALVTVGCGDSDPPADVVATCVALQRVVDDTAAKNPAGLRTSMDRLRTAVDVVSDDALRSEGQSFFRVADQRVSQEGMTLADMNRVGSEAAQALSTAFAGMANECSSDGIEIKRIPMGPGSRQP